MNFPGLAPRRLAVRLIAPAIVLACAATTAGGQDFSDEEQEQSFIDQCYQMAQDQGVPDELLDAFIDDCVADLWRGQEEPPEDGAPPQDQDEQEEKDPGAGRD